MLAREKPWRNIVHFSLRLNAMPSLRLPWPLPSPPLRFNLTAAYKQPRYYGAAAPPPLSLRMGGAEWRQLIIPFFCLLCTHTYTSTTFFFSFHLFFLFYVHFSRIFYVVVRLKKSRRNDDAVDVRAVCPSEAAKLQYWFSWHWSKCASSSRVAAVVVVCRTD